MKLAVSLLALFLATSLVHAQVTCPGVVDFCDCGGDCTDQPTFCACDEAQAAACCGGQPSEAAPAGSVTCPGVVDFCDCDGDCTGQPSFCACDEAQAATCCGGQPSEAAPAGSVTCPGVVDFCDCDGDCTGQPSFCACDEAQAATCCGGQKPSAGSVTCPGVDDFCDCGGDCIREPSWCACDEAQAATCCDGTLGGSREDYYEELDDIRDMLAKVCPTGLVGDGVACLPTCGQRNSVQTCLENIDSDSPEGGGEDMCSFIQNNILDLQSCFDTNGCCGDWVATVNFYKAVPGRLSASCVITDQCPDLTGPGCGANLGGDTGYALSSAAEQVSGACPTGELVVSFKNATGQSFCTGLKLDSAACAAAAEWEYECQADADPASTTCPSEFAAVQRLCQERNEAIVVAANVEKVITADKLEYPLTRENYQRMAGFLGLAAAWGKFDHDQMPVLRVELKDALSEDEQWLCGGEPKGAYMVLSSGPAASVVIPFVYLALSTALTMAGESLIDVGQAIKSRDFLAIGLVGLDGVSEVIGGSLFVSGLKSSVITDGMTIDQCTISGVFDGQEFKFGQGCGGLESMRTLGLQLPGMCTESTTLTVTGLIMGLVDIFIGTVIVIIYSLKRRRDRARRAAAGGGADDMLGNRILTDSKVEMQDKQDSKIEVRDLPVVSPATPGATLATSEVAFEAAKATDVKKPSVVHDAANSADFKKPSGTGMPSMGMGAPSMGMGMPLMGTGGPMMGMGGPMMGQPQYW